jgi:hypothetical protein
VHYFTLCLRVLGQILVLGANCAFSVTIFGEPRLAASGRPTAGGLPADLTGIAAGSSPM